MKIDDAPGREKEREKRGCKRRKRSESRTRKGVKITSANITRGRGRGAEGGREEEVWGGRRRIFIDSVMSEEGFIHQKIYIMSFGVLEISSFISGKRARKCDATFTARKEFAKAM